MVAPIDAKATFEVEGESFTLRLNFRALALAKKEGVNLLAGEELDPIGLATAIRCLAVQDHPELTDELAFALVVRGGDVISTALIELFSSFGGDASAEGKVPAKAK